MSLKCRASLSLCPLHMVPIAFLFAYLTVSGAVEPHDASIPKPPSNSAGTPPNNTHNPSPQHHSPLDDVENQLPYFFILQLPSLLADEPPTWSEWSQWTPCGPSCGVPSKRARRRHCQGAIESACKGEPVEWKACKVVPCPKEKTPQPSVAPEDKKTEKAVATVQAGKLESGKTEVTPSVERHEVEEAQRNGKKPETEKGLDLRQFGLPVVEMRKWQACISPCHYKIQLRRRWCYLGLYCVGPTREMRVCASGQGKVGACGAVNATDIPEFNDPLNRTSPWTDPRIGWSLWTPWTSCSSECGFHLQTINWSAPCVSPAGVELPNCHGQYELFRVCRDHSAEFPGSSSVACGEVENFQHWTMVDDTVVKHRFYFPSSSRLIHAIVIFVLFAPPIILLFYWLLSRARKPRYESLPSASPTGDSAIDANGQPSISADVTSALGPNHATVEMDPNAWKTM